MKGKMKEMKSLNGIKKNGIPGESGRSVTPGECGRSERQGRSGSSGIKSVKKLFNPLIRFTALLLIFILSFSALLLISGCKSKAASESIAAAAESESASNAAASASADTASAASTTGSGSSSSSSATTSAGTTAITTVKETATETATESSTESTEAIPPDITVLIKKADGYYSSGQYGLSKSTYRKAIIAIDASDLSDGAKQELKDTFNDKYNKSKTIVETALVHFGNAMQLEYETRYEEAKKELEAALAIYPKYEDAIEAYDNLKSIMGLE
jgi:tetratricopeptide (TPR) repeat protein